MTRSRGYLSPGVTLNQSHPRMEALFHDLHSKTVFAFDSTKKTKVSFQFIRSDVPRAFHSGGPPGKVLSS